MDKLPKDVIELIINKLTPREFFNYCKSETGQEFCSRKEVWLRRIQKDFGILLKGKNKDIIFSDYKTDPKKVYLELFVKTSAAAEKIKRNILERIGQYFLENFTKGDYAENLYNFFFTYLLRMLNHIDIQDGDQDDSDDEESSSERGDTAYSYFMDFDEWKKYLPLYNYDLLEMWSNVIGNVLSEYANEMRPSS